MYELRLSGFNAFIIEHSIERLVVSQWGGTCLVDIFFFGALVLPCLLLGLKDEEL